jgi:glycosyltransferase involved in cell wall biosynthesis
MVNPESVVIPPIYGETHSDGIVSRARPVRAISQAMPALFVDAERLRNLNSGLGQVCLHLGQELLRERQPDRPGGPWDVTFLVPKGRSGIFGTSVNHVEASWLRRLRMPGRYDVWHCLHQDSVYLPARSKLILTIYDLNFLERADYSARKKARRLARLQRSINRASLLTAGSAHTASVVREQLRVPDALPFRVVHTGVAVREQDTPAQTPPFLTGDDRPFFLFVGAIHPRKNVHTLVALLETFPTHRLVLAGPDHHPYAQQIRERARTIGVADRLLMPGAVDEATKVWLYARCSAFLFPSLSEGFGLPVVEAMVFGKPVFISSLTSLPEIGGSDAYYFENFEPQSMARVLRDGLGDFEHDPERRERLRMRAARFSWVSVAAEYWRLYEEVAALSRP